VESSKGNLSFKLIVSPLSDKGGQGVFEHAYDRPIVKIGRLESNELMLRDERRLVSGLHAEIRQKEDGFYLVDVGSKNGTLLNGRPIVKKKECPLASQDQIAIGDFMIEFRPIEKSRESTVSTDPRFEGTMFLPEASAHDEEVFERLNRAYWENIGESPEIRKSAIAQVLREALAGLDEAGAERILVLVEAHFPEPEYQTERLLKGALEKTGPAPGAGNGAEQIARASLAKIAARFLDHAPDLEGPEKMEAFGERLEQVLSVMIGSLAAAVKGRREFEEGFDVAATRVFSWKQNPIKIAEGERQIGAYLFDTAKGEAAERVITDLQETFMDLALHQMGLMAGFREGLRGLLKELDPLSLLKEAREAPVRMGPIPLRFGPFAGSAAWGRFQKKYRELSEEEVKTFEKILGPHFAKGYLAVQKKKKVP